MIVIIILAYFALLLLISRLTSRKASNDTFFRANRQSPWYLVAFGMIGASVSGISFVSVPGMVLTSGMTYLQTCLGFVFGYIVVAYVLLPLYYRNNVTSIYTLLKDVSPQAYKTGAYFFLVSKLIGAAARFFVPCYVIMQATNLPQSCFFIVVIALVTLMWLYTRKGGIGTLVWTDTLQTLCMILALCLILYNVYGQLGGIPPLDSTPITKVFEFSDWSSPQHFLKQFLSGIFIVIVMTGLDQDMMQKNLTCKNLRDAQKDMCTYGIAFLPLNALFLLLGVMLASLCQQQGIALPEKPDQLLPMFALDGMLGTTAMVLFAVGIVAAAFSSADSALTALTTSFCVDILGGATENTRKRVHLAIAIVFILCIMLFKLFEQGSLINTIYVLCSYTYGPLLGLFAYRLLHPSSQTPHPSSLTHPAVICLLSPAICYLLSILVPQYTGYHFGYELLMLNGAITYLGLRLL